MIKCNQYQGIKRRERTDQNQKPYESLDFADMIENDYEIDRYSPFSDYPLSGKLGIRTEAYGETRNHSGINRNMPEGTYIRLPMDVKYKNSGYDYEHGNWIELEDKKGNTLSYRNLMDFGDFTPGAVIPLNTPIARSGKNGKEETLREEYYSPEGRNITESYWRDVSNNYTPETWQAQHSLSSVDSKSIENSELSEKLNSSREAYDKLWDERYYKNYTFVPETEEEMIIFKNAQNIRDAAKEYGVNPAILASCIYTEQTTNVDWIDSVTDRPLFFADTSIGVAQVKVSTAEKMENLGYMPKTEGYKANGRIISRQEAIADKLMDDAQCIRYAAAYLRYHQDEWKESYPEIDGRTGILATLFNLGERNPPHANPKPNDFGEKSKGSYGLMKNILGMKE